MAEQTTKTPPKKTPAKSSATSAKGVNGYYSPSIKPAGKLVPARKGSGFGPITGAPKVAKPVMVSKPDTGPETVFTLAPVAGQRGKLLLAYKSRVPELALNTSTGLVAQIYSDEEVEIEPSILTTSNWPKNADKVMLSYKLNNAAKGKPYEVQGEVAYTVCHRKTKVCEPHKSTVFLIITP